MAENMKGVYPCWKNQFTIGPDADTQYPIADMENFSVAIDGNIEEWNSFENEGWTSRLVTGKSITVSVSGKRNVGDDGNDYVADLALKTGSECNAVLTWNFPSGAKLVINSVISVTEWGGGETRNVAPLAFEAASDGKPTFTPATQ